MKMELSRLLVMSPAELEQDIDKKLQENEALELAPQERAVDEDGRVINDRGGADGDFYDSDDIPNTRAVAGDDGYPARRGGGDDRRAPEPRDDDGETIVDHLSEQLMTRNLTAVQRQIVVNILGNLDSRGYLVRDARQIARDMDREDVDEEQVAEMIYLVRSLDPPGIAAFNSQDLLLLQLERMEPTADVETALSIVGDHYDELLEQRMEAIAEALGTTVDEVERVTREVLRRLNTTPAAGYASSAEDVNAAIEPQYTVRVNDYDGTIEATVNNRFPELQVSQSYKLAVADSEAKQLKRQEVKQIKENVASADFYIRMIKMRQETMAGILDFIVRRQRDYLLSGNEADLHPMVLREIAERLGIDTSTVSRATSGQYIDTPHGIIPVRTLFINEGDNIKVALRELIAGESAAAPLTDSKLAELLRSQGFKVERRTVVKYRTELGIASSRERGEASPHPLLKEGETNP